MWGKGTSEGYISVPVKSDLVVIPEYNNTSTLIMSVDLLDGMIIMYRKEFVETKEVRKRLFFVSYGPIFQYVSRVVRRVRIGWGVGTRVPIGKTRNPRF